MFKKATRQQAKLRMSIAGPSGSGKTYTALALAAGLSGDKRVAVLDTEHGSASLYADAFDFDVVDMAPPYDPDRFVGVLHEAAKAGYGVLVIDSISHAWAGTGGVLEKVDGFAKAQRGTPNTYTAWREGTKVQDKLVEAIKSAPLHIICTMRSKMEYAQEKSGDRTVIRKVGLAPVQREGLEYEFDIGLDVTIDHVAVVGKTRCATLADRSFDRPGADLAAEVLAWLNQGDAPPPPSKHHASWSEDRAAFCAAIGKLGLKYEDVADFAEATGKRKIRPSAMDHEQRVELYGYLDSDRGRTEFDRWTKARAAKAAACPNCGKSIADLPAEEQQYVRDANKCPACAG